jgi:hypothetical protein
MRALLALLLAAAVAGLAACEEDSCGNVACAPCPPTATVVVTDAVTGLAVASVAVTGGGAQWTCFEFAAETVCGSTPPEGGGFDVDVSAPGYATASVHLAPALQEGGNCCPDCFAYPRVPVRLEPLPAR